MPRRERRWHGPRLRRPRWRDGSPSAPPREAGLPRHDRVVRVIRGTAAALGLLLAIVAGACTRPPARPAAEDSPSPSSASPPPAVAIRPSASPPPAVAARPPATA